MIGFFSPFLFNLGQFYHRLKAVFIREKWLYIIFSDSNMCIQVNVDLKVKVEIGLAASLDLYLNVTHMIIRVHWLSGGERMCSHQKEITFAKKKGENFLSNYRGLLLHIAEHSKCDTIKLFLCGRVGWVVGGEV